MIKSVELKNYKSFKKVEIDFTSNIQSENKFSFIYGENGSGKSNIISVFHFLKSSINTIKNNERFIQILHKADKEESNELFLDFLKEQPFGQSINLKKIIEHENLLYMDSNEDIEIKLQFIIKDKLATYYIRLNPNFGVIEEKLNYLLEKNTGEMFHLFSENNEVKYRFSPKLLTNNFEKDIKDKIYKFWGNHTLLSIINYELNQDNANIFYLKSAINKNLINFLDNIRELSVDYKGTDYRAISKVINNEVYENIQAGRIDVEKFDKNEMEEIEKIVDYLFKSLYTDILKAYFVYTEQEQYIKYKLYFKKKIFGEIKDIPTSIESSGTKQILELVPFLISLVKGMTVIIDEIDTEIHDLLMKALIDGLMDIETGQLIATTHNTMLMNTLDKKNVFVIDIDWDANKNIINLAKHPHKLQNTHSLYNQYLLGNFGGIPFVEYFDADYFKNIAGEVTDEKE
ncbi:AAA family ATPase [Staphylococcus epidermidis]|nr:AAA family ATPase [Staphylococcus epidermidis]